MVLFQEHSHTQRRLQSNDSIATSILRRSLHAWEAPVVQCQFPTTIAKSIPSPTKNRHLSGNFCSLIIQPSYLFLLHLKIEITQTVSFQARNCRIRRSLHLNDLTDLLLLFVIRSVRALPRNKHKEATGRCGYRRNEVQISLLQRQGAVVMISISIGWHLGVAC